MKCLKNTSGRIHFCPKSAEITNNYLQIILGKIKSTNSEIPVSEGSGHFIFPPECSLKQNKQNIGILNS